MKAYLYGLILLTLTGCLSGSLERRDLEVEVGGGIAAGDLVVLPQTSNFWQKGSSSLTSTMSLPADFNDSFLVRGNEIISYLAGEIDSSNSYCMALHFPAAVKKLFFINLKALSNVNTLTGKAELYYKAFPGNQTENQNYCQNANLLNLVNADLGTSYLMSDIAYEGDDVCPTCSGKITSSKISIIQNQNEKLVFSLSGLKMEISPSQGTGSGTGPSCLINETCTNIGYNCCLNNQCVNSGELKPVSNPNDPDYLAAILDVQNNPSNYSKYPEYYYVCPINNGGGNNENPTDPSGDAAETKKTLRDLYECLHPQNGSDLSTCTLKITNATAAIGSGNTFSVSEDDLTMNSINGLIANQNITEIDVAGDIIYLKDSISLDTADGNFVAATENDDLTTSQDVFLKRLPATNTTSDILRIRYSVFGTCERVSSAIAKCTKIYYQGQVSTPAKSTDHATSQSFLIPSIADLNYNLIVKVNDNIVSEDPTNWSRSGNTINFAASVSTGQKVEITFFVTTNSNELTQSKYLAQNQVNTLCSDEEADLEPVVNPETNVIETYKCVYASQGSSQDPPFQSVVYLDAKTVPHKFFDINGQYWSAGTINQAGDQEGTLFEYTSNNMLRPNNVGSYIGFNEIYGSFKNGVTPPLPTQVITVEKNQVYDIFTDTGNFSTCLNCGTDYYSSLQRIFPEVFSQGGGGYEPDNYNASRISNLGKYRSDDLLFGRACFVPATMIPWTHYTGATAQTQRLARLKAQHFLFANGYNKDWYGFDYGSVIGSWDGVTWFSIGSARRVTAKSKRLYLAINAYFGDLTLSNNYKVLIQASSGIPGVGADADHDTETDGAECQQNHFCSTDQDCFGNLGYDYVCENVTGLKTPWPEFDNEGNEQVGSITKSLASLVGGTNGQNKRCVYRGRGAPCERGDLYNKASSYGGSERPALMACSPNNHCADLSFASFNDRINRYGASPQNQNASSIVTTDSDLVGLEARILGRPEKFIGTKTPAGDIVNTLNLNKVQGLCVPGRTPIFTIGNINNLNQSVPPIRSQAVDNIGNIGSTMPTGVVSQDQNYYLACPATNENGELVLKQNTVSTYSDLQDFATSQNLATNLLEHDDFDSIDLYNDDENPITSIGLSHNACLRAPGATCFSDMDCAGNPWMSSKIRNLASFLNLNQAEQDFWRTELICGNPEEKYTDNANTLNLDYNPSQNKCCRDRGLEFNNYSQPHEGSDFTSSYNATTPAAAGVNQALLSDQRYSLHQVAYEKIKNDTNYTPMKVPAVNPGTPFSVTDLIGQFNTLHEINSKMCCTGNWIRNFSDSNGGNNSWSFTRAQNIPRNIFRHINWLNNIDGSDPFECLVTNYATADCEIRYIAENSTFEQNVLNWLERLELAGIPQIIINSDDMPVDVDENQATLVGRPLGYTDSGEVLIKDRLSGTIDATGDAVYANDGVDDYFSLNDEGDFGSGLKKVFSDNEFTCCEPAGKEVSSLTSDSMCCTGKVAAIDGVRRCCLPDFTNLSVYLNRYVSSEGAGLSNSSYNQETGFINNPELVRQIALERGLCCSGRVAKGVAISNLQIPIYDAAGNPVTTGLNQSAYTRRFVSGSSNAVTEVFDNATNTGNIGNIYDKGVRWNNHIYCVPTNYQDPYELNQN